MNWLLLIAGSMCIGVFILMGMTFRMWDHKILQAAMLFFVWIFPVVIAVIGYVLERFRKHGI